MKDNPSFEVRPTRIADVEIRRNGVAALSIAYSSMEDLVYNSTKVGIKTKNLGIIITGRNLKPLVKALEDECVVWMQESGNSTRADSDTTFIEDIFIAEATLAKGFANGFRKGIADPSKWFKDWLGTVRDI